MDVVTVGAELLIWLEANPWIGAGLVALMLLAGITVALVARRSVTAMRPRHERELERIDERLTHICSAVELLTDTTESALRTAFAEIERLSAEQGRRSQRAQLQRRLRVAARSGQSMREIAQREGLSEGEVRLRLRLQRDLAGTVAEPATIQ